MSSPSGFAVLAIGGTLLFSSLTLVGWGIGFELRRIRRTSTVQPAAARCARSTASVVAGTVTVSTLGATRIAGSIDPIFGQPLADFGTKPAWSRLLTISSVQMLQVGLAVVPFTVVVRYRGF